MTRASEEQCVLLSMLFSYLNKKNHARAYEKHMLVHGYVSEDHWTGQILGNVFSIHPIYPGDRRNKFYMIDAASGWHVEYEWEPNRGRERRGEPVIVMGSYEQFARDMFVVKMAVPMGYAPDDEDDESYNESCTL